MQGDVCARLRDAVVDYSRAQTWNVMGLLLHRPRAAAASLEVASSLCDGDIRMAQYEIGDVNLGKASCNIDFENSSNVVPVHHLPAGSG